MVTWDSRDKMQVYMNGTLVSTRKLKGEHNLGRQSYAPVRVCVTVSVVYSERLDKCITIRNIT